MFPIEKMCRTLNVSRGGFYAWVKRPLCKRTQENIYLLERIKEIYEDSLGCYGSPRITNKLHEKGINVSRARVARHMKANGISAVKIKIFKVTTDSNHNYPVAPNLLERDFSAQRPNSKWVSDITYIFTKEGWLYLTVIIDLFNRMVVGWAMSNSLRAEETTIAALKHAYNRFNPGPGLIFHSDRGVQYACTDFKEQLEKYKMIQSMSAKGDCWDNAVAESFFSTLKKEEVYRNNYQDRWHARQSIFSYIEIFYNRTRKHSYLGNKSPVQFTTLKNVA